MRGKMFSRIATAANKKSANKKNANKKSANKKVPTKKVPTHEFVYFRCMRETGTKPQLSLEKLPEKIRQNQFRIQDVFDNADSCKSGRWQMLFNNVSKNGGSGPASSKHWVLLCENFKKNLVIKLYR